MISTSQPVVGLGWIAALDFPVFDCRFLYNARILNVVARSRRDLGSSRLWLVEDLQLIRCAKMISTS
jgi:hypothetical protein